MGRKLITSVLGLAGSQLWPGGIACGVAHLPSFQPLYRVPVQPVLADPTLVVPAIYIDEIYGTIKFVPFLKDSTLQTIPYEYGMGFYVDPQFYESFQPMLWNPLDKTAVANDWLFLEHYVLGGYLQDPATLLMKQIYGWPPNPLHYRFRPGIVLSPGEVLMLARNFVMPDAPGEFHVWMTARMNYRILD